MSPFIERRLFELSLVAVALAAFGLYELVRWLSG